MVKIGYLKAAGIALGLAAAMACRDVSDQRKFTAGQYQCEIVSAEKAGPAPVYPMEEGSTKIHLRFKRGTNQPMDIEYIDRRNEIYMMDSAPMDFDARFIVMACNDEYRKRTGETR